MARLRKLSSSPLPTQLQAEPTISAEQFGPQCEQRIRDAISAHRERAAEAVRCGETPFQLYKHQERGILACASLIGKGKHEFIVKHTVGSGKTNLIGFFVASLDMPTLLLEPFVSLIPHTQEAVAFAAKELKLDQQKIHVVADTANGIVKCIDSIVADYEKDPSVKPRVIMTYYGFISLYNSNPDLFARFSAMLGVVVSNEVHLSFGKKTQSAFAKARGLGLERVISVLASYVSDHEEEVKSDLNKLCTDNPSAGREFLLVEAVGHLIAKSDVTFSDSKTEDVLTQRRKDEEKRSLIDLFLTIELSEEKSESHGWKEGDRLTSQTLDGDELYTHVSTALTEISELVLRDVMTTGPRKTPLLNLLTTGTLPFLVEEAEEVLGIPVADVVTMHELDAEGLVIIPTERNLGKAKRTSIGFVMEDGRTVLCAVLDELEKLRGTYGQGLPPTIITCGTIREAEAGRLEAAKRNMRALRCTTGNADFAEGTSIADGKAALERMPEDPNRIEILFVVRQGATGLNIPTLRVLGRLAASRPGPLIQGLGRIDRSVKPSEPWPPKDRTNTTVIMPTFFETVAGRNVYYPGVIEALIIAGEVPIEYGDTEQKRLKGGRRFHTNIPFIPRKHDHLRHLLGSIESLAFKGLPIDLSKQSFSRKEMGSLWRVSGERIIREYCPQLKGTEAARYIGRLLWPADAERVFFDGEKTEHIHLMLPTPEPFFTSGKIANPHLGAKLLTVPEKGWEISGTALLVEMFGTNAPGEATLREVIGKHWPVAGSIPEEWLRDPNLVKIKAMIGGRDNCLDPEFFARVFEFDGRKIVGWRLFEQLVESQNWDLHGNSPRDFMARVLFSVDEALTKGDDPDENVQQELVVETIRYADHNGRTLSDEKDIRLTLNELLSQHGIADATYEDSPAAHPPPRGLVSASCTALGLCVVSYGSNHELARKWAAREMIHEVEKRKTFNIDKFRVTGTDRPIRKQFGFSDVLDASVAFSCGELLLSCYKVGAPQPVLLLHSVEVRGDLVVHLGQLVVNGREALIEGFTPRAVINEGCKALATSLVKTRPSPAAVKRIVFQERCFIGLLARERGMPNVNKLIARCSLDPRFPMTLLDGRMHMNENGFTASYSNGEFIGSATRAGECEAWDAAALDILAKLPSYDPHVDGEWKDAIVSHAKYESLKAKISNPLGALQDAVMKRYALKVQVTTHDVANGEIRVTVQIPFPVGPLELSAFGPRKQAKSMGKQLSFAMYAMLEIHGMRPFSL